MKTPNDKPTLQNRILTALRGNPLNLSEIAHVIGMDSVRTMAWMKTLREDGLVRLTADGKYEVAP